MQKNLVKSSYLAKKKALVVPLLSTAKLVKTACVPRAPGRRYARRGLLQTKTNQAKIQRRYSYVLPNRLSRIYHYGIYLTYLFVVLSN